MLADAPFASCTSPNKTAGERGRIRRLGETCAPEDVHFAQLQSKLSGVSVRVEPRNMMNGLPRTLLRNPMQSAVVQGALQEAIPDMDYTDPKNAVAQRK